MDFYTIEDIELLRKKSGLSYQEAVALLDYHSGNLARALIDLEKNGRLKSEEENIRKEGTRAMSENHKKGETREKAINLLQKLYRSRVKIRKGDTNVVNVSVLFAAACLLLAPHMTIAGVIISMILGYQFSFTRMDPDFAAENLEKMVRSAAQNAKSSVSSVVQTISHETKDIQKKINDIEIKTDKEKKTYDEPVKDVSPRPDFVDEAAESLKKQAKELEDTMDSFFDVNPAATTYHSAYSAAASSVPTIQVPVQTETKDGNVTLEDDTDGYSSVIIG